MASRLCAVFENSSKIVIVMEYASKGDLYDYISERQRLTEQEARHFFRQVVSAVYYCHKVGWYRASHHRPGGRMEGWAHSGQGCWGWARVQCPMGKLSLGLGGEESSWLLAFPGKGVNPAPYLEGAAALGLAGRQCPSGFWEVLALASPCLGFWRLLCGSD